MRVPWKRLTWILAAALPVAAVAGIIWVGTRDLSRFQSRMTEQVRKVTGRELAARVPLTIKLGTQPAMVAEGVTLTNASWGSRPDLARVRKLTLFLDPASLFLGEVKIGRVLLEGADILVERNEVGDTNLDMLPPPDGSGPHPGENRSLRLRTSPAFPWINTIEVRDSVLTIAEGQGRPPVVLEIAAATFKSPAPNQPLQLEGKFSAPQATPLELTGTAGSFDGWMRGLPGNIDVQGGFGGGKIAIKGSVDAKGTTLGITSEGPDVSAFGPYIRLPVPAGGPYALNAKAGTQRSSLQGRGHVAEGRLERTRRRGGVPRRPQGRADRHRQCRCEPPRSRRPQAAATVDGAGRKRRRRRPVRLVPTMPFSASWLGRSAMSVTVRLGEIVGLGSKVQNASVTLTSSETRFTFRAAATVGGGSAGFDLVYDPTGRIGQATLTASASRVSLADLTTLLGFDRRPARCRGRHRPAPARRRAQHARCAQFGQRLDRGRRHQGPVAARPVRQLAGRDAAPAGRRRHRRAVQLHRRPLRRERRRRLPAPPGGRHAAHRPWWAAAISSCAPKAGSSSWRPRRATTRTSALASPLARQGRQRPRDGRRARAQPGPPDHSGRRGAEPDRPDQPGGAPGQRQSLRRRGAARRRPAARARAQMPVPSAADMRQRGGRPQAQTAGPQRSQQR